MVRYKNLSLTYNNTYDIILIYLQGETMTESEFTMPISFLVYKVN